MGAPRPPGHAPTGRASSSRRSRCCSCSGRRSCTSGSTRPTPASCRRASRRAPPSTASQAEFGEGAFAPIAIAVRTDGAATGADNLAAPLRLLAATRRRSAGRRVDSLVDVDPRLTPRAVPAPVRRPQRPARPVRRDGPGGHDPRRPDGLHPDHALRPEPRRGPGARRRPARSEQRARAAGRDGRPRRRRRGRRRRRRRWRGRGLPADRPVHHRHDLSRAVRAPALGRAAGQGAGHEHAVDRRELRGARLDLPGRQPVGARSGSSRSGSSRRRSR